MIDPQLDVTALQAGLELDILVAQAIEWEDVSLIDAGNGINLLMGFPPGQKRLRYWISYKNKVPLLSTDNAAAWDVAVIMGFTSGIAVTSGRPLRRASPHRERLQHLCS